MILSGKLEVRKNALRSIIIHDVVVAAPSIWNAAVLGNTENKRSEPNPPPTFFGNAISTVEFQYTSRNFIQADDFIGRRKTCSKTVSLIFYFVEHTPLESFLFNKPKAIRIPQIKKNGGNSCI